MRETLVRRAGAFCCVLTAGAFGPSLASAQSLEALRALSVDQLGQIPVTTVSRSAEALSDAPASVFVITHDDIMRSGSRTLPEILRLAPNLEVAQLNSSSYAISARGFNVGLNASLSNKLLVLVDGRSVYSPMFGGVYWDMLDLLPEQIERIEVISGPGATLWGSNAVQGVINIITRRSEDAQGGWLTIGGGNIERQASIGYGGRLSPDLTYSAHADITGISAFPLANGHSANDAWWRPGGGLRFDWTPGEDQVTLRGDLLTAVEQPGGFVRENGASANWTHALGGDSSLQLLTYYDDSYRAINNGSSFDVRTYDAELQHNLTIAGWNQIVWGAGERHVDYSFENSVLALQPPSNGINLADLFAQDTISLDHALKLTFGAKLENEPYASWQFMPSLRLAYKPVDGTLLWGAISRALRSPTPVDSDFRELLGNIVYVSGSNSFRPEAVTAYELGLRSNLGARASLSLTGYYNVYGALRSVDPSATPSGIPYVFGNRADGHALGLEGWGSVQATPWWRLSAGFFVLRERLHYLAGAIPNFTLGFLANDPGNQETFRSSFDCGDGVTWDMFLRRVDALPHPKVPGYTELDTRIGWAVTPKLQFSLAGFNLLHPRHPEFVEPGVTTDIPRSVFAEMRVRF